ncbi:thiamine biosynthesis protein ThiF [Nonomuraea sp. M3C6]|uniref:Thiamine biosynthesis protein ThiF n=1 Tax=Nonomuraea marmarensis TaxID=3351344 RepID=A0ABW7A9T3_9ACTN
MRPRVKPALRRIIRDEHTLQYGVHPLRAVMLSGLTRSVRQWIEGLDGTRELDCVLRDAAVAGLDEFRARALLDQLAAQGALHDAAISHAPLADLPLTERDRLRPDLDALDLASTAPDGGITLLGRRRGMRVRVYGAGRVGAQVVALLAVCGVGNLRVIDPGQARPGDITPGGLTWAEMGMTREAGAVAVARRLTYGGLEPTEPVPPVQSGGHQLTAREITAAATARATAPLPSTPSIASSPGSRSTTATPTRPGTDAEDVVRPSVNALVGGPYLGDKSERPDLVVLAPVGPLDGVLVNELTSLGIPHLLVSAFEGHGIVGPLVLPSKTACLHCLDLTRRDHDPAWPMVTARLGGYPPGEIACDATLAALVAAEAVGHALTYLDGKESVVTNGTMDVTPDWRWKRRSWSVHPQCRCMRNNPYSLRMVMAPNHD